MTGRDREGRVTAGERVVCHITYTRLMMRPVENYSAFADDLISTHGARMSQLLGREDALDSPTGFDYSKAAAPFSAVKSETQVLR